MSNSSLVDIKVPAHKNNYTIVRDGRKIEMVTIHHMTEIMSAEQCGRMFFQDPNRKASSHYGIGTFGEIAQYVDEKDTAWSNSNWDANCKSVTIEVANFDLKGDYPITEPSLKSLIKLIADIAKRNELGEIIKGKNLTWHSMYVDKNLDKNCPGEYILSKIDYIINQANLINLKTIDKDEDER